MNKEETERKTKDQDNLVPAEKSLLVLAPEGPWEQLLRSTRALFLDKIVTLGHLFDQDFSDEEKNRVKQADFQDLVSASVKVPMQTRMALVQSVAESVAKHPTVRHRFLTSMQPRLEIYESIPFERWIIDNPDTIRMWKGGILHGLKAFMPRGTVEDGGNVLDGFPRMPKQQILFWFGPKWLGFAPIEIGKDVVVCQEIIDELLAARKEIMDVIGSTMRDACIQLYEFLPNHDHDNPQVRLTNIGKPLTSAHQSLTWSSVESVSVPIISSQQK